MRLANRLGWLLVALAAAAVPTVAGLVEPTPRGVGSHLSLGLPPCGFLALSGVPCPTCGMTTALARAVRLELGGSLRAHPLGLPLLLASLCIVPLALRGLVVGESPLAACDRLRADRAALVLCLALLAVWAARLVQLSR